MLFSLYCLVLLKQQLMPLSKQMISKISFMIPCLQIGAMLMKITIILMMIPLLILLQEWNVIVRKQTVKATKIVTTTTTMTTAGPTNPTSPTNKGVETGITIVGQTTTRTTSDVLTTTTTTLPGLPITVSKILILVPSILELVTIGVSVSRMLIIQVPNVEVLLPTTILQLMPMSPLQLHSFLHPTLLPIALVALLLPILPVILHL
mmetsp:Transcript_21307/g.59297  ORF Transcript_21307/g.59297 Transcript_21307/m.59297 type:complete len:206 (+) Transcript_21307:177-794(+)